MDNLSATGDAAELARQWERVVDGLQRNICCACRL
jgi:hypothetical protein